MTARARLMTTATIATVVSLAQKFFGALDSVPGQIKERRRQQEQQRHQRRRRQRRWRRRRWTCSRWRQRRNRQKWRRRRRTGRPPGQWCWCRLAGNAFQFWLSLTDGLQLPKRVPAQKNFNRYASFLSSACTIGSLSIPNSFYATKILVFFLKSIYKSWLLYL